MPRDSGGGRWTLETVLLLVHCIQGGSDLNERCIAHSLRTFYIKTYIHYIYLLTEQFYIYLSV